MKKIYILLSLFILVYTASRAQVVDLTSGGAGMITAVPQSYNETRGVDVTVLGAPMYVTSMTLHRFCTGGPNDSGFVSARIYNSANQALLAYQDTVVHPMYDDSVVVPLNCLLSSGQNYRISFSCYGYGNNNSSGSAFLYEPTFPYNESGNLLQINSAHGGNVNAFPGNPNIFVPVISLTYTAPVGFADLDHKNALQLSPNPLITQTILRSETLMENAGVRIYNLFGQEVKRLEHISGYTVTLQRDELPAGIYLMKLIQDKYIGNAGTLVIANQ